MLCPQNATYHALERQFDVDRVRIYKILIWNHYLITLPYKNIFIKIVSKSKSLGKYLCIYIIAVFQKQINAYNVNWLYLPVRDTLGC